MKISSYIYEHRGVRTRIQAAADGILRITRTRREEFLAAPATRWCCPHPSWEV